MFVGDELSEPRLPAQTQATAAMLPDDLCVVIERTSGSRLLAIAASLTAAMALGFYGVNWIDPDAGIGYAFVIGGVAALAWLLHRDFVRRHREFRLRDDGIMVEVTPLVGGPLRVTHVRWAEIADYAILADAEKAVLRVASVRGYTVTLNDRPPRPSTREFIRRFAEQAERHPRAADPGPCGESSRLPDVTGERAPALGGCLAFLAITVGGGSAEVFLGLSYAQEMTAVAVVSLIAITVAFWLDLDDPETARSDAKSNRLFARLRRWLRRVLGIRVT